MNRRIALMVVLALAAPLAGAQGETPPPAQTVPAAPAPPPAAPEAPRISVEDAYRKEFAFLQAQKRELEASLNRTRSEFERDKNALDSELAGLESRLLGARAAADQMAQDVAQADEQAIANEENTGLLAATYEQAGSTLSGLGVDLAAAGAGEGQDDATRLRALFAAAVARLGQLSGVRREQGRFFLADGSEVEGEIIRYGNVAAFGVSPQGSGALAPAGGDRFKLWHVPADDTAQALAAGQTPPLLKIFVYESLANEVEAGKEQTLLEHVNDGGTIGWITVALGVLAMLFALLRAIFLGSAGADTQRVLNAVTPLVRERRIDDAIAACKRYKGSAARVVTAALRNIDRDAAHLEDIISESILHESGRLNRFGAIILVIAAVAPLLGLLGTVTGMIQTFDIITEFGTSDPKMLSGGIAIALVTTEIGLVVAIPCLLFGNLLSGWAERIKDDMEQAALRVTNLAKEARGIVA